MSELESLPEYIIAPEEDRPADDDSEPDDFDAFWTRTLDEARTHDLDVRVEDVDTSRTATVR